MSIQYNFDELVDRSHTHSVKWDIVQPNAAKDTLPMWIAEMDFPKEYIYVGSELYEEQLY